MEVTWWHTLAVWVEDNVSIPQRVAFLAILESPNRKVDLYLDTVAPDVGGPHVADSGDIPGTKAFAEADTSAAEFEVHLPLIAKT